MITSLIFFIPFILFPIFMFLYNENLKFNIYLVVFYYLSFFSFFIFSIIESLFILKLSLIFIILILFLNLYFIIKLEKNNIISYWVFYLTFFNLLKSFFYNKNIDTSESLILSIGYGQIINYFLITILFFVYIFFALYIYLKREKFNNKFINFITFLFLFIGCTICGIFYEIPYAILKMLF